MPRPTSGTTISRPDLAAVAYEYIENQTNYIGLQVLPEFGTEEKNGEYPVIPLEALLSVPDTKRAPKGKYNRGDWEFENDNYNCLENGWEEPVDDVEARHYSRFFDVEEITMQRALAIVLRNQEKRIAGMVFNASNFTAHAVTNEWDDASNATPITDVKTGIKTIHNATGLRPNALIISHDTFLDLGVCAQIIDRIKYTVPTVQKGDIPVELLALAFGVDRVLVGDGMYNAAKEGQEASLSALWNHEYAMLCVISNSRDLKQPCIGRTFKWTKDCPENAIVESYRDETVRGDVIRARQHTDEELMLTAAAYLLSNITE